MNTLNFDIFATISNEKLFADILTNHLLFKRYMNYRLSKLLIMNKTK